MPNIVSFSGSPRHYHSLLNFCLLLLRQSIVSWQQTKIQQERHILNRKSRFSSYPGCLEMIQTRMAISWSARKRYIFINVKVHLQLDRRHLLDPGKLKWFLVGSTLNLVNLIQHATGSCLELKTMPTSILYIVTSFHLCIYGFFDMKMKMLMVGFERSTAILYFSRDCPKPFFNI